MLWRGEIMRFFRVVILVIAFILIIIGVLMLINGSLEMYPTSEQQDKVHLTGAAFAFVGVIISIIIFIKQRDGK